VLRYFFSSYLLIFLSAAFWFSSLYFVVFLTTRGDPLTGQYFLLAGWLGPLVGEFSWFANLLYGWALLRLLVNVNANVLISTSLSVLLVMTSLLYVDSGFDLSVGASKGEGVYYFYGIGIGYYLWLASMVLLLAHRILTPATSDGSEGSPQTERSSGGVKVSVSVVALTVLCVLIYMSFSLQSSVANGHREMLNQIFYVPWERCEVEDYAPIENPVRLNTPLRLESALYKEINVKDILQWQVDAVRVGDYDYRYDQTVFDEGIAISPAIGESDATLLVETPASVEEKVVRAQLIDEKSETTVFDHVWKYNSVLREYCPVGVDGNGWFKKVIEPVVMRSIQFTADGEQTVAGGGSNTRLDHRRGDLRREYTALIPPSVKPVVLNIAESSNACEIEKAGLLRKGENTNNIILDMMEAAQSRQLLHLSGVYYTVPGGNNLKLYCDDEAIYLYSFRAQRDGGYRAFLREVQRPMAARGFRGLQVVDVEIPDRPNGIGYVRRLMDLSIGDEGMEISVGYHDDKGGPMSVYTVVAREKSTE